MNGELLRKHLHSGERVYGTHVVSLGNPVAAKIQSSVPYDFVFICTEHMPVDRTEVSSLCQLYSRNGISPMVRIPSPDPYYAAMAIDGGAEGIVVPYLETVDEAKSMIGAVKYRPIKGKKLEDIIGGRITLNNETENFLKDFNKNNYLIIGIESVFGYENLDALLKLDGIDGIFVGPHDLTISMEIPEQYKHKEFIRVVTDIIHKCRKANKGVGMHVSQLIYSDDYIMDTFIDQGMNFILYGADIILMKKEMEKNLSTMRQRYNDSYQKTTIMIENISCIGSKTAPDKQS
jgi:2-keto-3-deoxy-L-rhamnonate aldolase RhmA